MYDCVDNCWDQY